VLVEHGNTWSLWDLYENRLVPHPEVICNYIACVFAYHDHVAKVQPSEEDSLIDFSQPISVQLLAQETNLSVEQIKTMNPVFRSDVLVPLEGYSLALPPENVKVFTTIEQKLYEETAKATPIVEKKVEKPVIKEKPQEKAPLPKKEKIVTHKVKLGETLTSIAKKHHVTITELVEWNHLESDFIREGQELIIKK
jgi:membrane-bound lytic murein transglycosylase D